MDLDINQYLDIFVEESKEHLESMNDILLELEKDTDNKDLLNELFRISHTLKGMAGTMGFTNMANLTHDMEDVLQAIRSDEIKINTDIVDILFECLDSLEFSTNYVSENRKEDGNDHLELIGKLKDLLNGDKEQSNEKNEFKGTEKYDEYVINAAKQAKEKGLDSYKIYIRLSEDCMLKSARAFIIFNTIESFSEIIYSYPSVEDIEDEKFDLEFSLVIVTDHKKEEIKEEIEKISEIDEVNIGPVEMDLTKKQVNKKEKSKKSIDKNNVNRKSTSNNMAKTNRVGKTVRVDIDRLDTLMNLVSELIIIKTRMEDMSGTTSKEDMNEAIEYLERITTNLHDAVMKVRMVPIERVFNRFPRMVRDLSKELDKEINLEMSGEETEVDRTVIDEIGDPLIHLIRNSIDHGIEHPDERIKLGKDKEGTVKLKAYPDGNNVVIEVEDDGAGIDHEKVKKKAIEKEIITEQDAEILTKEESVELLFKAGFSTSDIVSDVSGRGVGLDVVKSKIESINGSIEVETFQGKGTRFIIRIPLTLAIIQGLLVKLGEEIYAIPLSSISEITILESEKIRKVQGQEIILYRDKTLPIVRLNSLVGIEDKNMDELTVVIVRKGDKQAGLIVDDLIGQQEIVIKPLGKFLSNIKYLAGATILGNGKISLILDVNSLF
ncbi:chemotaxis protein CheA [Anaerosalibacter bizertensis]|uniref:Chemotaxis protein CheA n=1 Tax=Anaerosalibacter bizertensis TaxID=932217 RepID=A0A9Q4ABJ8_9FIRM|nr:chemotaxis protein CheA [Anaerosalibacter bizertensis]MBU5293275.1 chemotaxis protein CheA [Anaerosalibacter bizertensis]MCB5558799.1 chemotaxis protein CheA [Anaerosalibacter bizertensis]MCG4564631.1 chemotaxis protein CheA [Anaerosalibacter bizertensis]MCG4582674.1 chemotaxis protein CheA [Anaerosalibacter bizertensis]